MPSASAIRLGTRGSQLALWQANTVATCIAETGGPPCRIIVIKTSGDRLQDAPLSEIGGKSLFVKEIEDALLKDEIDIAVHSSKDMPALLPNGLAIGAVLPREDPRDAVVLPARAGVTLEGAGGRGLRTERGVTSVESLDDLMRALGQTPVIGTASVRRIAQLMRLFRGARFGAIRGNLDTRLRKLDAGDPGSTYDALVLAAAGLRRLGFASRISFALPVEACVPAPGQGIVAIEIRADATEVGTVVARINDMRASAALTAERAVVNGLGGGCQTPIGALASPVDGGDAGGAAAIDLVATVVALDGSRVVRARARGPQTEAAAIGARVAAQLQAEGAAEILADARIKANTLEHTQH